MALSIVAELSKRLLTVANPPNFIHSKDIKSNPVTRERESEWKRNRERERKTKAWAGRSIWCLRCANFGTKNLEREGPKTPERVFQPFRQSRVQLLCASSLHVLSSLFSIQQCIFPLIPYSKDIFLSIPAFLHLSKDRSRVWKALTADDMCVGASCLFFSLAHSPFACLALAFYLPQPLFMPILFAYFPFQIYL